MVGLADIMNQQELLQQNFARNQAGLGDMAGLDLERFTQRQEANREREVLQSQLSDALLQSEEQAQLVGDAFLRSGLSDVAQNFRNASRRSAFNQARRGLTTGSADIEAREQIRADTTRQIGEQVAQSQEQQIAAMTQALQRLFPLQQQTVAASPFTQAANRVDIGTIQNQTRNLGGMFDAELDRMAVDAGTAATIGDIINQTLSNAGPGLGVQIFGT